MVTLPLIVRSDDRIDGAGFGLGDDVGVEVAGLADVVLGVAVVLPVVGSSDFGLENILSCLYIIHRVNGIAVGVNFIM